MTTLIITELLCNEGECTLCVTILSLLFKIKFEIEKYMYIHPANHLVQITSLFIVCALFVAFFIFIRGLPWVWHVKRAMRTFLGFSVWQM